MTAALLDPRLIAALKTEWQAARAEIQQSAGRSAAPSEGALEWVQGASDIMDRLVVKLVTAAYEMSSGSEAAQMSRIAVVAVGGYGRRELCPHSDVDLLFIVPDEPPEDEIVRTLVDRVLYGLWDSGLEVGHAVRTIEQCKEIALADQTAKTGMVDARLIELGTEEGLDVRRQSFRALELLVAQTFLGGRGAQVFIDQKLTEAEARDRRFGRTIYMLEPEVKSGQGGLRDMHTARWVARARWKTRTLRDLLKVGVLSSRELKAATKAYTFLLRVRCEIHLRAGRRREALGFEYQEKIAEKLGYCPEGRKDATKLGTERFMRAYYFHAQQNRRIARLIIERATSHARTKPVEAFSAPGGFKTFAGMLTVADRKQFTRDPTSLMRIFRVAQDESFEIYTYTKDLIAEESHRIDAKIRRDPDVVKDFLAVLEGRRSGGRMLDLMHEIGILRRFIPEFTRVTSRWQHSLYHVYTVDIHSLFVVKMLKRIREGSLRVQTDASQLADMRRRFAELPRPSVVYMAGFLHDVGKGWRSGDHSVRGEKVARTVGQRFEAASTAIWTSEETEDVAWLVREHLLMSNISQRRDLSDPELIDTFAKQVRNLERLTMLYLLTVADMNATSPKVWTTWKAALLHELFEKTRMRLAQDSSAPSTSGLATHVSTRRARAVREMVEHRRGDGSSYPPPLVEAFVAAVPDRYVLAVSSKKRVPHLEAWRKVSERGGVSIRIDHLRRDGVSELTVLCPDQVGLLSMLAGTIAANGLQILSAEVFSVDLVRRGRDVRRAALDILYLTDADGSLCEDQRRWDRLRDDLKAVLRGDAQVDDLMAKRAPQSGLTSKPTPAVRTKLAISRDDSRTETVIDVFCRDHLGVLYTISKALAEQSLSISLAKISTQGHRVADGFYVTDASSGLKISDEARLKAIVASVRDAIDAASASVA